jgi:Holliday junction DNA helicase RuvA
MGFMLSYLRGHITEKNLDSKSFVIDVNGLGYLVQSNLKVLGQVQVSAASEIKIYVSMQVREDGQYLYGFLDRSGRDVFEMLLSVSGVGPKGALSILEVLTIDNLVSAVLRDKPELIAEAQGIGLKTAKRIILDLNNKLKRRAEITKADENIYKVGVLNCSEEASAILENLGFSLMDIDKSLEKAVSSGIEDETEALVRYCLAGV